jgi:hypothetical protein
VEEAVVRGGRIMELDYCGDKKISDPTVDQVLDYLSKLTTETDSFLILAREEQVYIQACKSDAGFYVEFRDGGEDEHYSTSRNDLTLDEATSIFQRYYLGDPSFRDVVEFKAGMYGPKHGCLAALLLGPLLWLIK